jgi:hypothetical protein
MLEQNRANLRFDKAGQAPPAGKSPAADKKAAATR